MVSPPPETRPRFLPVRGVRFCGGDTTSSNHEATAAIPIPQATHTRPVQHQPITMSCGGLAGDDGHDDSGDVVTAGGCGGGACGSGACGEPQQPPPPHTAAAAGSHGSRVRRQQQRLQQQQQQQHADDGGGDDTAAAAPQPQHQEPPGGGGLGLCRKCKAAPAAALIRQREPYCWACIEGGVQQRARVATKAAGLLRAGDAALLALSGGSASAALLHCLVRMRAPLGAPRPERGRVAYALHALHVVLDCCSECGGGGGGGSSAPAAACAGGASSAAPAGAAAVTTGTGAAEGPPGGGDGALGAVRAIAAAAGLGGPVLVLPLCDMFADDEELRRALAAQQQQQQPRARPDAERHARLVRLLGGVADPTGREDVAAALRDRLLLRAARALGCGRLLRGDCATRIAVRVIADAAKGRGHSLPADIQALDARWLLPPPPPPPLSPRAGGGAAAAAGGGAAGGGGSGVATSPTDTPAPLGSGGGGGPVVLRPLREVTRVEVVAVCAHLSIPFTDRPPGAALLGPLPGTAARGAGARSSTTINALVERFVEEAAASLPSSVFTLLRTAGHLRQFAFTQPAAVPEAARVVQPPSRRGVRAAMQAAAAGAAAGATDGAQLSAPRLCALCGAPLPPPPPMACGDDDDNRTQEAAAVAQLAGLTQRHSRRLCYSCNRQVLQQLALPPPDGEDGDNGEGSAPAATAVGGRALLAARLRRLRELLPDDVALDDDDSSSDEED